MWYYKNDKNNIVGSNPNDMAGNTGWVWANEVVVEITNKDGIPLYQYDGANIVKRLEQEIEEDRMKLISALEPEESMTEAELLARLEALLA